MATATTTMMISTATTTAMTKREPSLPVVRVQQGRGGGGRRRLQHQQHWSLHTALPNHPAPLLLRLFLLLCVTCAATSASAFASSTTTLRRTSSSSSSSSSSSVLSGPSSFLLSSVSSSSSSLSSVMSLSSSSKLLSSSSLRRSLSFLSTSHYPAFVRDLQDRFLVLGLVCSSVTTQWMNRTVDGYSTIHETQSCVDGNNAAGLIINVTLTASGYGSQLTLSSVVACQQATSATVSTIELGGALCVTVDYSASAGYATGCSAQWLALSSTATIPTTTCSSCALCNAPGDNVAVILNCDTANTALSTYTCTDLAEYLYGGVSLPPTTAGPTPVPQPTPAPVYLPPSVSAAITAPTVTPYTSTTTASPTVIGSGGAGGGGNAIVSTIPPIQDPPISIPLTTTFDDLTSIVSNVYYNVTNCHSATLTTSQYVDSGSSGGTGVWRMDKLFQCDRRWTVQVTGMGQSPMLLTTLEACRNSGVNNTSGGAGSSFCVTVNFTTSSYASSDSTASSCTVNGTLSSSNGGMNMMDCNSCSLCGITDTAALASGISTLGIAADCSNIDGTLSSISSSSCTNAIQWLDTAVVTTTPTSYGGSSPTPIPVYYPAPTTPVPVMGGYGDMTPTVPPVTSPTLVPYGGIPLGTALPTLPVLAMATPPPSNSTTTTTSGGAIYNETTRQDAPTVAPVTSSSTSTVSPASSSSTLAPTTTLVDGSANTTTARAGEPTTSHATTAMGGTGFTCLTMMMMLVVSYYY